MTKFLMLEKRYLIYKLESILIISLVEICSNNDLAKLDWIIASSVRTPLSSLLNIVRGVNPQRIVVFLQIHDSKTKVLLSTHVKKEISSI